MRGEPSARNRSKPPQCERQTLRRSLWRLTASAAHTTPLGAALGSPSRSPPLLSLVRTAARALAAAVTRCSVSLSGEKRLLRPPGLALLPPPLPPSPPLPLLAFMQRLTEAREAMTAPEE